MPKDKHAKEVIVTVQGPNLSQLTCWEKYRAQMEHEVYTLFKSRHISLYQLNLVVVDALIFSHTGNTIITISQGDDVHYYPDEVEKIVKMVLRQVPAPVSFIK